MTIKDLGIRILFPPRGKHRLLSSYIRGLFVLNPLITLFLCFFLGDGHNYFHRCWVSLTIGAIVSNFCWLAVMTFWRGEIKLAQVFKKPRPVHGRAWYFSISLMAMPVGLYLACDFMNRYGTKLFGYDTHIASTDYRSAMFAGTMIAGIFFLLQTAWDLKESARKAEKEMMQAQISALTAQMNPHLLFNALNTVAALVDSDPRKAEEMILVLSDLYRGVLKASKKSQHSLAEELALCRSYLSVEKARFGDRLVSSVIIDDDINVSNLQIPALSIQPLVENAVKHGISLKAEGGTIKVRGRTIATDDGRRIILSVEDDGVGMATNSFEKKDLERSGTGTGLKNTIERYKLQYGDLAQVRIEASTPQGTRVTLEFPEGTL